MAVLRRRGVGVNAVVQTDESRVPRKRQAGPSQMKRKVRQWDNRTTIPRIVGRGDYRTTARGIGRAIRTTGRTLVPAGTFNRIGASVGAGAAGFLTANPLGALAGGLVGGLAGDKFAQLVGFGDYQVKRNSLMDLPMGSDVASFGNMSNATIIRHREYVKEIKCPALNPDVFDCNIIQLNPGLRSTFPWLSTIAGNYQEYQFIGCVFEFRSTSSESAAVLPLGSIIIASNYDTADAKYNDKRAMENSQFCVSGKPSKNLIHPVECDPSVTFVPIKHVRSGGIPPTGDSHLYDHANVQVATEGLPIGASGSLGELWVTYEIALYKPSLGLTTALRDHFYATTATVGTIDNTPFTLGTTPTLLLPRGGSLGGLGMRIAAGGGLVFPIGTAPGRYEVTLSYVGAAGFQSAAIVWTGATTVVLSNYYVNNTATNITTTALDVAPSVRTFSMAIFDIANSLNADTTVTVAATFDAQPASYELQVALLPSGQT